MSNISQLPSFALRRRTPGLPELGALLDQLPDAHLLLDSRSKRILSGNARAAELTAYSGAELNDLSFDVLFSHYDERIWGKQSMRQIIGNLRYQAE
jgi:PAS domain-containing protein